MEEEAIPDYIVLPRGFPLDKMPEFLKSAEEIIEG